MPTYKSLCGFAMSVNLIENPFKRKWLLMVLVREFIIIYFERFLGYIYIYIYIYINNISDGVWDFP